MADQKISQLTSATTPLAGTEVLPIVQGSPSTTVKVSADNLTSGRVIPVSGVTTSGANPLNFGTNGGASAASLTTGGRFIAGGTASALNTVLTSVGANGFGVQYANNAGTYLVILPETDNGTVQIKADARSGSYPPVALWTGGAARYTFDTTGNVAVNTAAKGINFTANTAAAGMTSQLLNWYEEGTWTPTATSSSGTITTVGAVKGLYTRIGRQVTVFATVAITDNGTGAGALRIAGLPWAPNTSYISSYVGNGVNNSSAKTVDIFVSSTMLECRYYDASYPVATGQSVYVTATYFI